MKPALTILCLLLCASLRGQSLTLVWQQPTPLPTGCYYLVEESTNWQGTIGHMGDTGLASDNYVPTNFTKFYPIASVTNMSFKMPRPADLLTHGFAVCATNPVNHTCTFATTK